MTTTTAASSRPEPELRGQTVVVIGGSAGIGLETARRARREGADVVLVARDPNRLEQAARQLQASSTAALDATDPAALARFFADLPAPIDHVMVTGPGPHYAPLAEASADDVRREIADHVVLSLEIARNAAPKMRAGGSLTFMGGTGGRRISRELGLVSAAGFVDTPLSASYFADGESLERRREHLRATLPIGRVVEAADVGALAVHLMTNTALTGATYDIDGGQHFVS